MFGHTKILHILSRMGSAALAAAVLTQVRHPEFPANVKEVLEHFNNTVALAFDYNISKCLAQGPI